MKIKFSKKYFGVIAKPVETFENILGDRNHLSSGLLAVSITAILYTFVYVFLIFGGGQPFKPWLKIPLEVYYKYNVFFCAPTMFLGWILAAGVVHLLSRSVSDQGSFEQILTLFGFGISLASWTTGIHDIVSSFLGAVHVINQRDYELALNSATIWRTLLWVLMIAYVICFIILFSKAVKVVYGVKLLPSIIFGTLGFIIYQLFFIVFNR